MSTTADKVMGARGDDVATVGPDARLADVVRILADRRIGAVVVTADDEVRGIVSERDIVRLLADEGPACLDTPVSQAMTGDVSTCSPSATTDELMATMTAGRFRHVPVTGDGGRLIGIVSIGDIVKSTIEQLQIDKESLTEYVTGGY